MRVALGLALLLAACHPEGMHDPNGGGATCDPSASPSGNASPVAIEVITADRAQRVIQSGDSTTAVQGAQGGVMIVYRLRVRGLDASVSRACVDLRYDNGIVGETRQDPFVAMENARYRVDREGDALLSGDVFHLLEYFGSPTPYIGKTLTTTLAATVAGQTVRLPLHLTLTR